MKTYAGLDVSQQETQICVISDDGEVLFGEFCGPSLIGVLGSRAEGVLGTHYLIHLRRGRFRLEVHRAA